MHRYAFVAAVFAALALILLPSGRAFAITAKQKMETCKFGADHPMLSGKKRADFLAKCMSNKNDPRGPAPAVGNRTPGEAETPDEEAEPKD